MPCARGGTYPDQVIFGSIPFAKGHGTQNDFVVLPDLDAALSLTPAAVAPLCDRRRGLGAEHADQQQQQGRGEEPSPPVLAIEPKIKRDAAADKDQSPESFFRLVDDGHDEYEEMMIMKIMNMMN